MSKDVEPAWLDRRLILEVHVAQLAEHGGAVGIRAEGLLERALARPPNHAHYTGAGMVELAAIYALAIAPRNHPFIDGNKRPGCVAMELFLAKNGYAFDTTDAELVVVTLRMAAGTMPDDAFIDWVRSHARAAIEAQAQMVHSTCTGAA